MHVVQRHRQVPGQHVVEQLHVGGALHIGVTAQRHHAAAGPADIAEEELQHAQRPDLLDAVGGLVEVQRVGDGPRLLGTRVQQKTSRDLLELAFGIPQTRSTISGV